MNMNTRGSQFGKFDITTSTLLGGQYVVEGHWAEWHAERGGMYQVVDLSDGTTAQKFADEMELITRHADNSDLDREYSELATAKNHAFGQMQLELAE